MQPLPFWGKRDLKREVAEADAEQAQGRVATTWSELAASVKTSYARYYLVVHNERLIREILDLLARLERIALVRYESGLAPQQDVIRAQVELTTMRGELLMLESEREGLQATLNSLLARKSSAPFAAPERLRPRSAPGEAGTGCAGGPLAQPQPAAVRERCAHSRRRRRTRSSPTGIATRTSPSAFLPSRWARASASGK